MKIEAKKETENCIAIFVDKKKIQQKLFFLRLVSLYIEKHILFFSVLEVYVIVIKCHKQK
jgi:hypothetical protein